MHALLSRRPALVNRDHFRTLRCRLGDGRFRWTSGSEPRTSGPSVDRTCPPFAPRATGAELPYANTLSPRTAAAP
jgi:hypothetical protein